MRRNILFRTIIGLVLATIASAASAEKQAKRQLDPIELRWMNNEDPAAIYRTADHPGSVFVLEAFFNTCPYCNQNSPRVDQLSEEFAEQGNVQVLDVSRDCRTSDYRAWISRHNPNHPVLNDCNMQVLGRLGTRLYPTTYVLDCNLNVVGTYSGAWNDATYRSIKNLVANTAASCVVPTPE